MPAPPETPEFWVEDAPDDGWAGPGPGDDWAAGDPAGVDWAPSRQPGGERAAASGDRHDGPDGWGAGDDFFTEGGSADDGPALPSPSARRWVRWTALAAGLVVIAGIVAWQSRGGTGSADPDSSGTTSQTSSQSTGQPPATRPSSTTADTGSNSDPDTRLPVTESFEAPAPLTRVGWEVVGYGPLGLSRYAPGTGQLVTTPVPPISSIGPPSFATTSATAVLRPQVMQPMDGVTGYAVADGQRAERLEGLLSKSSLVLPGPDGNLLWALLDGDTRVYPITDAVPMGSTESWHWTLEPSAPAAPQLVLVDAHGTFAGNILPVPDTAQGIRPAYVLHPDGNGFALFDGVGGVYSLTPAGTHLVTHGRVLATGPAAMLIYECDDAAACGLVVTDQKTGERRPLQARTDNRLGLPAPSWATGYGSIGVTSPDGAWAAMSDYATGSVTLLNLSNGDIWIPIVSDTSSDVPSEDRAPVLAFADRYYLLIARSTGIMVIDVMTGTFVGNLPMLSLSAMAVRPGG